MVKQDTMKNTQPDELSDVLHFIYTNLTAGQIEVLNRRAIGQSFVEIAYRTGLSEYGARGVYQKAVSKIKTRVNPRYAHLFFARPLLRKKQIGANFFCPHCGGFLG